MPKLFLPDSLKESQPTPKLFLPPKQRTHSEDTTIHSISDPMNSSQENTSLHASIYEVNTSIQKPISQSPVQRNKVSLNREKSLPDYFLCLWNEKGAVAHKRPNTKVYKQSLQSLKQLIDGTFFNDKPGFLASEFHRHKFTTEEWELALERLNLILHDPEYIRPPAEHSMLKKLSLPDFLYNPYRVHHPTSVFLKLLKEAPLPARAPKEHTDPELTRALIKMYDKILLGGMDYGPCREDSYCFIRASNRLRAWYNKNKHRIPIKFLPITLAKHLIDSIRDSLPEHRKFDVMPHWLASDVTFNRSFPKYLYKEGLLMNDKSLGEQNLDRVGTAVD